MAKQMLNDIHIRPTTLSYCINEGENTIRRQGETTLHVRVKIDLRCCQNSFYFK